MSRAAGVRSVGDGADSRDLDLPLSYFDKSQTPLTCLVFLLPFVILYEFGTLYFATDYRHHTEQRILAFQLMQVIFHWFGASGRYLPALSVVTILLSWHMVRRDPWDLDFGSAGVMLLESFVWCVPLIVLDALSSHYIPLQPGRNRWPTMMVMSIGAGVYEELFFRLILVAVLSILLSDLCRMPKKWSAPLIVVLTAVAFSSYHYWGGAEAPAMRTFVFRAAAGIYFSLLFYFRGFGITAGSHAAYDIIAVMRMAMVGS